MREKEWSLLLQLPKGDGGLDVQTGANSQGSLLSPRGFDKGHHQKTLQSLVWPTDYYLLLAVQVSSIEITMYRGN